MNEIVSPAALVEARKAGFDEGYVAGVAEGRRNAFAEIRVFAGADGAQGVKSAKKRGRRPQQVLDYLHRLVDEGKQLPPSLDAIAGEIGIPRGSMGYIWVRLQRAGEIIKIGHRGIRLRDGRELWRARQSRHRQSSGRQPDRRFKKHAPPNPDAVQALSKDHPAVLERRTLFPTTVVSPLKSPRVLVSGKNQRKLGDWVSKGPWRGMPIFALTLEERKTCPETCHHWRTCYGSGMPLARRHEHGPELEATLRAELASLQQEHPDGFVVRLHVLGDFYSTAYVRRWAVWLEEFPALRVFGYTAWSVGSAIGAAVAALRHERWDRFAIRTSSAETLPTGATTIWRIPEASVVPEGIVCPAQTNKTGCCGSCGLCWHPSAKDKTIVFVAHGTRRPGRKRRPADVECNRAKAAAPWPAELSGAEHLERVEEETAAQRLPQPVQRRCQTCDEVFTSRLVGEDRCPRCRSLIVNSQHPAGARA